MATVSANKLELLQIAEAVAREKAIDRKIVLAAMEDAIAKAARSRYGSETEVRAEIDAKSGELHLSRHMLVMEAVENPPMQSSLAEARRRHPAAQHPGARRHEGAGAAGPAGGPRPPIRRIQGSHRRHRQRHRQTGRIRQRGGRSRPRRSHRPPRRDVAARSFPQRRSHPRLHLRCSPRAARPANLSLAYAP